jgi:hypothetical protein
MISQMTMITNESQARTLEHGPTQTQAAYQLGTSACIQESQIRAVDRQSGFGSIWVSGKVSERRIRMTQTRGAKPRLKVVRDARLNVRVR